MNTTTSLKLHLLGPALALALAGTVTAAEREFNLSKSFQVTPGGDLVLDADRGSVEISTSDRSDVIIEVKRSVAGLSEAKAAEAFEAHLVTFEQEGNRVFVRGKAKERSFGFRDPINKLRVEYKIQAPQRFNYDLRTAAGSISVGEVEGRMKAKTSGGSLRFAGVNGSVDAHTSAGSIRAGTLNGPVSAVTSGGSIQVDELGMQSKLETAAGSITVETAKGKLSAHTSGGSIHAGILHEPASLSTSAGSITVKSARGTLDAKTSGGSINIEDAQQTVHAETSAGSITATFSAQPSDDTSLSTSGGGITVKLDSELAFDLDARTSGGRVSTDIPVTMTVTGDQKSGALKGKLNGGGKALMLRTSAGNIQIRRK